MTSGYSARTSRGFFPRDRRARHWPRAAAREDDYLTLLACGGFDCIGDVVVREASRGTGWDNGPYTPLSEDELRQTLRDFSSLASSNFASRLSLAGTQGKVGLAHMPGAPMTEGWMRPEGGASSTHILKASNLSRIAEFEFVCLVGAGLCGISVARTCSFSLGSPVICSEHYGRQVSCAGDGLLVTRLHQEDLAQAFGVTSRAKYLELEGGSYRAIAHLPAEPAHCRS
ncbi:MAG: HipA domain-containing protein [Atopobiaceae bacterium]|nr:HipA domain-containing protein [Atopobiaceae bacterium]